MITLDIIIMYLLDNSITTLHFFRVFFSTKSRPPAPIIELSILNDAGQHWHDWHATFIRRDVNVA